ncbi:hypothetical protein [Gordonia sp. NPDC003422]
MKVDYLRGNLTASATGLFVICRHLSGYENGRPEEDLRQSLQLLRSGADNSGPILKDSLAVGQGIGLLGRDQASSNWHVEPHVGSLFHCEGDQWPAFRGDLLRKISEHGLGAVSGRENVPDLVRVMTLFMQADPLSPLDEDHGRGPEAWFEKLGFDGVTNSTQWNSFKRWATSLGLARRSSSPKPGVVIPDATTAIADQLGALPASGSAREWLASLRERLPILGSPALTSQLPSARAWDEVPPAVVLGLLKLEKSGVLVLEPSDDASNVLSMGLGATLRQIGRIKVGSRSV